MKNLFATAIGTSFLTAGILSMSALGASAASLIGTYGDNDSAAAISTLTGKSVEFYGKYEYDEGAFEGNEFAINFTDSTAGTVFADIGGAGYFAVKAGSGRSGAGYDLYYTNDLSELFSWNTANLGNKDLSHLSVYRAEVPEPLTLMGSAVALGFGGYFQRKRNAKKSA